MPVTLAAWQRVFQILLVVIGALFIGAVVVIMVSRMDYPYELEWMEGGTLQTVHRLASGLPLYVPPTVEFVPFIYTPLYFFLGAGLSHLLGDGFLPLRLLSFLASLGSMGLIFSFVRRRTQTPFWGFMGMAFFAACFEIGGGWFDLARVDALYLFFLLLAVSLLECRKDKVGHLLAGLVFVLAFLTKQSALLVLFPVLVWTLITGKRNLRWLLPAVALGGIMLSIGLLEVFSGGWFSFYVFQLPAAHQIAWPLVLEFWRFDLLAPLPFALLSLLFLMLPANPAGEKKDAWWLLTLAAAFIGSAYFSRLHAGGWNNVLLPAYAMLAIILPVSLGRLFRSASPFFRVMILGICFLQFSLLIFDPRDHLPTGADKVAGDELLARLASTGGEIWMPHHGWLGARAGGGSSAHSMAIEDVLRGGDQAIASGLEQDLRQQIEAGRWQLIVLDNPIYAEEMVGRYKRVDPAVADTMVFWPVTGLKTRPSLVYERIPPTMN